MEIAVCTCKHGRDKVNELFLENMKWLRKHFDLHVFMATTHGETFDQPWVHSFKYPNNPLGAKWNAVYKMAMYQTDSQWFLGMGDDDLISPESLNDLLSAEEHHVGTKSINFIDPKVKRAVRSTYLYKCDKLIGAGRLLSREAVEASANFVNFQLQREVNRGGHRSQPGMKISLNKSQAQFLQCRGVGFINKGTERFMLFDPERNNGLDHTADIHLVFANYMPKAINLTHELIDVKTKENIWSFKRRARDKGAVRIDYNEAIKWLNKPMMEKLNEIGNG